MYRTGQRIGWGSPLRDHGPDPDEYFAATDAGTPEKRLRLAVLLNAITNLQRGPEKPAAMEAEQWVRGELDAMHASFSFRAICETLDLDAEHLAQVLLRGGPAYPRLPRRQVRTQRVHGVPRRYRPRVRIVAAEE